MNRHESTGAPSTLEGALQQFGSPEHIPDEILQTLGYSRNPENPNHIQRGSFERIKSPLETKKEKSPFNEIVIPVHRQGRFGNAIPSEAVRRMKRDLELRFTNGWEQDDFGRLVYTDLISQDSGLPQLEQSLAAELEAQGIPESIRRHVLETDLFTPVFDTVSAVEATMPPLSNKLIQHIERSDSATLGGKESLELSELLERHKAKELDPERYISKFSEAFHQQHLLINAEDFSNEASLNYLREKQPQTTLDLAKTLFTQLCENKQLLALAKIIQTGTDVLKISQQLSQRPDPYIRQLETKIRSQKATNRDTSANADLAQMTQELAECIAIQRGLINFFNFPNFYTSEAKAYLNKAIKSQLVKTNKKSALEASLILDGTLDVAKDSNPGKISGDCTEDKPLPFLRAEIPLYNIKAYYLKSAEKKEEQTGNIYLLKTETVEAHYTTWHLEAIQIPSDIDWETSFEAIVQAIAAEAKRAGVAIITINKEPNLISNYDYIQSAAIKYHTNGVNKYTNIELPFIQASDTQSALQSNGRVRVIWYNPAMKIPKKPSTQNDT